MSFISRIGEKTSELERHFALALNRRTFVSLFVGLSNPSNCVTYHCITDDKFKINFTTWNAKYDVPALHFQSGEEKYHVANILKLILYLNNNPSLSNVEAPPSVNT
ncbi:hypothetical protein ACTXT7_014962 [Hymenolepis weldensis]